MKSFDIESFYSDEQINKIINFQRQFFLSESNKSLYKHKLDHFEFLIKPFDIISNCECHFLSIGEVRQHSHHEGQSFSLGNLAMINTQTNTLESFMGVGIVVELFVSFHLDFFDKNLV